MTDTAELIARLTNKNWLWSVPGALREEAAAVIAAQAQEIERLKAELASGALNVEDLIGRLDRAIVGRSDTFLMPISHRPINNLLAEAKAALVAQAQEIERLRSLASTSGLEKVTEAAPSIGAAFPGAGPWWSQLPHNT